MKKIFLFLCGWILVLLCFVACGGDDESELTIEVTSVRLSQAELILTVGESHSLTAKVLPENATDKNVTWKSSDASIATVSSSGAVKAIGAGTATITATAGGKSATCLVTVKQKGGGVDASIAPWDENDIYEGTVN